MKELERIRWRCRRGMLELDLVLERFVGRHYTSLGEEERNAFGMLLEMPDAALWDMITGKSATPETGAQAAVLARIRAA